MDIFADKSARLMLIGRTGQPFDDSEYLYELKLDGERCLAYLDDGGTTLVNNRGRRLLPKFPELQDLHTRVGGRCILDGELIITTDGKPDFEQVIRRGMIAIPTRVQIAARQYPATLVVFDILYLDGEELLRKPLAQRKALLENTLRTEDERLSLSRTVEGQGKALFEQARLHGLEGVVAKRTESLYHMGRRTKDWVKFKNIQDDEYIICGYVLEAAYVTSLLLGQYAQDGALAYKGRVTMGLSREDFALVQAQPRRKTTPFAQPPPESGNTIWLQPKLVCTVQFLYRTRTGGIRNPVYKGLRLDKSPLEVVEYQA